MTSTPLPPDPDRVPPPLRIAASWSWRVLVIVAAAALVVMGLGAISLAVIPLAVAVLVTAILSPLVGLLHRRLRFPTSLASLVAVIALVGVVGGLLTFAGTQIAAGFTDLFDQARAGLNTVLEWLHSGPLKLSDKQLDGYLDSAREAISSGSVVATGVGWATSVGHFLAGTLITLFATFFFLAQGQRIAVFLICLLPRAAQERTYQAGRRGWVSLTNYVRVQVIVAAIDAVGVGLGALILRLPLVVPLSVLVFVTSFVPIVGAIAAGAVAVLIALVTHGPTVAIVMLGVVILVQQVESHGLQPFLMGRAVDLHPLAVLIAVVVGGSVLGIVGALFAVPVLAVANSVIRYFHGYDPLPELGTAPMPRT